MDHGQSRHHQCRYQGCTRAATCLPRLYVPKSRLSVNQDAEDVSAMMGLPICDTCFSKLTAREFLEGERGQAIREQITQVFKERGAFANFDKAVIGRVSQADHDFGRFEDMQERARAN